MQPRLSEQLRSRKNIFVCIKKKHVDDDDHDTFALSVPYSYPHRHSYRDSLTPGCPIRIV